MPSAIPLPTAPSRTPAPSPLAGAVVAAAVDDIETAGPLDDQAELREAFHTAPTRALQVRTRAWLLGQRLGLPQELARWRHALGWVVALLALLVALAGLGAARGVLAPDRSINAVAAFVSLLGLHAFTLLAWLLGLAWSLAGHRGGAGGWSFGRLALNLAARLPLDRGPHALTLLSAFTGLLRRNRLWPWLTGMLSHGIWTLAFGITLAVLMFAFSFHDYRLSWETTILSAGFFQHFVHATGLLPAALGFPVPGAAAVQQVGNAGAAANLSAGGQREWAWWLIGCVAVYGLLPRALLVTFSLWRWRAGVGRMEQVDMTDPGVRRIVARLDALEPPPRVIDPAAPHTAAASAPAATLPVGARGVPGAPGAPAVIGFELPPDGPWPPAGLPASLSAAGAPPLRVAGGAAERAQALQELRAQRPAALLLVCHAPSSPDRGTARFVREASALAERTAIWLTAGGTPVPEAAVQRWREWAVSERFVAVTLVESAQAASEWIASGHG
ncbi:MAG: DUF2868 domain-containing protein [Proteobacteria bacterium]|nr:DUF2868 domain-containing protein [Pseudomonadota bacterium]